MTEVTMRSDKDGLYYIEAKGHADYNPGNDIVCASVSTLVCTLNNAFALSNAKPLREEFKPGYVVLEVKVDKKYMFAVNTMFRATYSSFEMMAEQYPNNVKLVGEIK